MYINLNPLRPESDCRYLLFIEIFIPDVQNSDRASDIFSPTLHHNLHKLPSKKHYKLSAGN